MLCKDKKCGRIWVKEKRNECGLKGQMKEPLQIFMDP